jgi:hypothetical protein
VDLRPRATTIEELRQLPLPTATGRTGRLRGVETATFRIRARLVAERRQGDRDIHLLVADPTTNGTMITELPDARCFGPAQSAQRNAMATARAELERACGPAPFGRLRRLAGSATVTGVGFHDEPHHPRQPGVAPDDVELHPVLALTGLTCRSLGVDPPVPPWSAAARAD